MQAAQDKLNVIPGKSAGGALHPELQTTFKLATGFAVLFMIVAGTVVWLNAGTDVSIQSESAPMEATAPLIVAP